MRSKHKDLSAGVRSRSAWIVVPALLAILSVAGFVAKPVMGLGRAETQRERAKQNAQAYRAERAILQSFEDAHGSERTAEALRALSAKLSKAVAPIEVNGALRLLADAHRIALSSVAIASPKPTTFAVLDDRVVMREVDLRGSGALVDWVELTDDLERCGYSTSVLDVSIERPRPQDPIFEVHLSLGLYSSQPAAAKETGGA